MRRPALLVTLIPFSALLLTGCTGSGFWAYERHTLTLPGANPNLPPGSSENYERSRHGQLSEPAPLLTEAGDIWPGPNQPVPTLKDLQKQQTADMNAGSTSGAGPSLAPLPPLPSLPGYEISPQDPAVKLPPQIYPNGEVAIRTGHVSINGNQSYKATSGSTGNIVVPNGNGTSTVISPTGQVTTIPTPK